MAFDTQLARTIKANFAAKSFAQLQEIAKADSEETWSPEAIAAANELLVERNAGHAAEPAVPEPPPTPPAFRYDPSALAVGILGTLIGGATAGYLVYEYFRKADIAPDLPQPFGPRLGWLALDTTDTNAVVDAIALREAREVTWAEGIEEAYKSLVFVTPPLGDWTLVASTSFSRPKRWMPS